MWQLCLLTQPLRRKWALSLTRVLSTRSTFILHCSMMQLERYLHYEWFLSRSCWVNCIFEEWTCEYVVRIQCRVNVKKSCTYARWRIKVSGISATLSRTAAMSIFKQPLRLLSYINNWTSTFEFLEYSSIPSIEY